MNYSPVVSPVFVVLVCILWQLVRNQPEELKQRDRDRARKNRAAVKRWLGLIDNSKSRDDS
jgi:hypothetical protein